MIPVIHDTGKLLYEQIYEFYRDAIIRQKLKFNERLPSHRTLAKELGIGNNTVIRAYEQLIHEGYIKNESRKGLFVAKLDAHDWQLQPVKKPPVSSAKRPASAKPDFKLFDHLVDEKNFPLKHWRKCTNWALDHMSFQYEEHAGKDPLKEQLQQYLFYSRGVSTTVDRLIIGSGTTALLFWLAFVLRKTHKEIVFEEPCYHRPRHLFSEFGYRITPVRVNDDDGIDLQKLLKQRADLLYLTPSHQYPMGSAVPVGNRIQILNWAKKNRAFIIEDDFDCEFRYKTRLMPSLQGLDKYNRVIYVGSFSSSLMPSLRVAYLVLPEDFPVDFRDSVHLTNTVPYITRRTLAYFMESGYWERHLKKMRKIYQEKYNVSIAALKKLPENCIHFNNAPSGLNIFLRINSRQSEQELIRRALGHGVSITPVSGFYHKRSNLPRQPELLFEFGNLPLSEIGNVVEKLYHAWFHSPDHG